jgi:hypothetical protein
MVLLVLPQALRHAHRHAVPVLSVLDADRSLTSIAVTEHPNPASEERLKSGHFR